jgi:hypothetical protein
MKTRLDLILDRVKCGKREVTFDMDGYTVKQKERVRAAAKARGLDAAGHGRWLLVRDLSCMRSR